MPVFSHSLILLSKRLPSLGQNQKEVPPWQLSLGKGAPGCRWRQGYVPVIVHPQPRRPLFPFLLFACWKDGCKAPRWGWACLLFQPEQQQPVFSFPYRKLHSGMKTYGCELCGKRFLDSLRLRMHLLAHSGRQGYPDRPFQAQATTPCPPLRPLRAWLFPQPTGPWSTWSCGCSL